MENIDIPINVEESVDKKNTQSEVFLWLQSIIISIVIVIVLNTFIFRMMGVYGESMQPYLNNHDRVVTTNFSDNYAYGDIVAIKRKDADPLVKRVIAVEGQTVNIDYDAGEVYVDDKLLDEPYIMEPTIRNLGLEFPITVPENHIFVMGDNRNHSDDSRNPFIGTLDKRFVFGKVGFRLYPFNNMGKVTLEDAVKDGKAFHEAQEKMKIVQ